MSKEPFDFDALERVVTLREKNTGLHRIPENSKGYYPGGRIKVTYGFDMRFAKRHNQRPHFHVVGEIIPKGCRTPHAYGCLHEDAVAQFPHLKKAIRWHLWSWPGTPMHYFENAMYHFTRIVGIGQWEVRDTDLDPVEAFRNHINSGILADDEVRLLEYANLYSPESLRTQDDLWIFPRLVRWGSEEVRAQLREDARYEMATKLGAWLQIRQKAVSVAFVQDMVELGVAEFVLHPLRFEPDNPSPSDADTVPTCSGCAGYVSECCDLCGRGRCCAGRMEYIPGPYDDGSEIACCFSCR